MAWDGVTRTRMGDEEGTGTETRSCAALRVLQTHTCVRLGRPEQGAGTRSRCGSHPSPFLGGPGLHGSEAEKGTRPGGHFAGELASRARVLPSAAGVGAAASAHASHPPSRSGWLAEAVTLLSSAGTSPGRK